MLSGPAFLLPPCRDTSSWGTDVWQTPIYAGSFPSLPCHDVHRSFFDYLFFLRGDCSLRDRIWPKQLLLETIPQFLHIPPRVAQVEAPSHHPWPSLGDVILSIFLGNLFFAGTGCCPPPPRGWLSRLCFLHSVFKCLFSVVYRFPRTEREPFFF